MCSEYSGQVECYIVVKFCGSVKQIFGSYLHQCFGINDDDDGGKNGDEDDQIVLMMNQEAAWKPLAKRGRDN